MATQLFRSEAAESSRFNWYQQYAIRRFHPRRILMDAASLPWVVYFLWLHNWASALIIGLAAAVIGVLATNTVDAEKYSRTILGRLALLHLHPTNLIVQAVGLVAMVWALWTHSTLGILGALSVIFLGHMVGWDDVWSGGAGRVANKEAA
ncbi:MAG: hypothetical protein ACXWQO_19100 [Bdellovibrionota bacterium]